MCVVLHIILKRLLQQILTSNFLSEWTMDYVSVHDFKMLSKNKTKNSVLVSHSNSVDLNIPLMIVFFAHLKLLFIGLNINNASMYLSLPRLYNLKDNVHKFFAIFTRHVIVCLANLTGWNSRGRVRFCYFVCDRLTHESLTLVRKWKFILFFIKIC